MTASEAGARAGNIERYREDYLQLRELLGYNESEDEVEFWKSMQVVRILSATGLNDKWELLIVMEFGYDSDNAWLLTKALDLVDTKCSILSAFGDGTQVQCEYFKMTPEYFKPINL